LYKNALVRGAGFGKNIIKKKSLRSY